MRTKEILDKYDTTDQHYIIELKEKLFKFLYRLA